MIDASAALDFLGHTVVIALSQEAADALEVDIELAGTANAVSGDAIGLGLPTYLDPDGALFWVPLSGIEDSYADLAEAES